MNSPGSPHFSLLRDIYRGLLGDTVRSGRYGTFNSSRLAGKSMSIRLVAAIRPLGVSRPGRGTTDTLVGPSTCRDGAARLVIVPLLLLFARRFSNAWLGDRFAETCGRCLCCDDKARSAARIIAQGEAKRNPGSAGP